MQRDAFLKGFRDRQKVTILPGMSVYRYFRYRAYASADKQESPGTTQDPILPDRIFTQSEQTLLPEGLESEDRVSAQSVQTSTTPSEHSNESLRHQRLHALHNMAKRVSHFVRHGKQSH